MIKTPIKFEIIISDSGRLFEVWLTTPSKIIKGAAYASTSDSMDSALNKLEIHLKERVKGEVIL